MRGSLCALVAVLALLAAGCCRNVRSGPGPGAAVLPEVEVQLIPLPGPASLPDAQLSGMAWHGNTLVLLPQYPVPDKDDTVTVLFAIERDALLAVIDGHERGPLTPRPISLPAAELEALKKQLPGWEGFEAIAFSEGRVFASVEARDAQGMKSYLLSGTVDPELTALRLDTSTVAVVRPPPGTHLDNLAEEALVVTPQQVLTLFEANGEALNPAPKAHAFSLDLQPRDPLTFPHVEYRITDASPPDAQGRFWAINYFYPGDTEMDVSREPLAERYGWGTTHTRQKQVERLLRFQLSEGAITLVDEPPVYLKLREDGKARNWEALAVLEGRGLLLATDTFPETFLGFVPLPR